MGRKICLLLLSAFLCWGGHPLACANAGAEAWAAGSAGATGETTPSIDSQSITSPGGIIPGDTDGSADPTKEEPLPGEQLPGETSDDPGTPPEAIPAEIPLRSHEGTIINVGSSQITLIARLNDTLPLDWPRQLRYTRYPVAVNYIYITASSAAGRALPTTKAKTLKTFKRKERIPVSAIVQSTSGDGKEWFMVEYYANKKAVTAFVAASSATLRGFQLGRSAGIIRNLEAFASQETMAYVHNYKNRAGRPPTLAGKTKDALGNNRDQAAPLYDAPGGTLQRYAEDGTLLGILETSGDWSRIRLADGAGEYWTPSRYLSQEKAIKELRQAIVVDRRSQNIALFEKSDAAWSLISLSLATTGGNDKYRMPTPLGLFQAIERRSRFQYLGDISQEIEGYAPYATRFSGGAYIHGVPVNYVTQTIQPETDAAGNQGTPTTKRIDPGMREYLSTIGTVPLSHKCVRNYTSHAKFVYDWVQLGQCAVIVIE